MKTLALRIARCLPILPLCLALVGCAGHYQLGTTLSRNQRDVYVPAIVNESSEPSLHQTVTARLLREIQRDGTLNLVSDETSATVILEVTVTDFTMDVVTYQADDKHTGREYRGTLHANMIFRDRVTGNVLCSKTLQGEEEFDASGDLTSAKRRMMPSVCKDLAENIVEACTSLW